MKQSLTLMFFLVFAVGCTGSSGGNDEPSQPAPMDAAPNAQGDMALQRDTSVTGSPDLGATRDAGVVAQADMGMMGNRDDCVGLCEYLEMCGSCFYDPQGECLDIEGCAEVCLESTPGPVAACAAGLAACDDDAFQGCYDANIGDDDCAQTCRFLDDCDECFLNESGECLSLASCAVVCRESTPPAAAACIANLSDCAGISDCYAP